MTTHPSNPNSGPTEGALPDELLLDLVEGSLRSEDVERVRSALKGDPRLARRLEAMRADRRSVVSLSDRGVSPAPAGLVLDALATAERADLLDTPDAAPAGPIRRLAPALIAACIGIVAIAGWYVYSEGLVFSDDQGSEAQAKAPRLDNPELVIPGTNLVQRMDIEGDINKGRDELAQHLQGHVGSDPSTRGLPDMLRNDTALGAPFDLANLDAVTVDGPLPLNRGLDTPGNDNPVINTTEGMTPDEMWNTPSRVADAPVVPDAVVPDDAAEWIRAGRLSVTIAALEPVDEAAFSRRLARRLYVAFDPSVSNGWGMTSLPSVRLTDMASATGNGWSTSNPTDDERVGERDRPMVVTLRIPRDATDEEILALLRDMANGVRALTSLRVVLEERPADVSSPEEAGTTALTVENLLWWRKPASLWTPMTAFHVPVEARASGAAPSDD